VTACTGIDAIAHATETSVTKKRTMLSSMYSRQAFGLCLTSFSEVLVNPNGLEARGRMLVGAALAGLAIENSMLGAAHAAANPLTSHYGIVHGEAVGLMLPHVVRFNGSDPAARRCYKELTADYIKHDDENVAEALAEKLEVLLDQAQMPRSLAVRGVKQSMIPMLAEEAARQWTATFNPRSVAREDFARLYEAAFETRRMRSE
jgi:alcohol dehydrogenase